MNKVPLLFYCPLGAHGWAATCHARARTSANIAAAAASYISLQRQGNASGNAYCSVLAIGKGAGSHRREGGPVKQMQSESKIGAIMYDGCVLEVLVVLDMIQSRAAFTHILKLSVASWTAASPPTTEQCARCRCWRTRLVQQQQHQKQHQQQHQQQR
jgi:hypothetical protein